MKQVFRKTRALSVVRGNVEETVWRICALMLGTEALNLLMAVVPTIRNSSKQSNMQRESS